MRNMASKKGFDHEEFFGTDWYYKDKLKLTLMLYKCNYVHKEGIDESIKIVNEFYYK